MNQYITEVEGSNVDDSSNDSTEDSSSDNNQETTSAYMTDAVGQVNSKKLVKQLMNQTAQHTLHID